ncbi:MAG TPA: hypothetical protein PKK10_13870 [Woeseiaceae bacterium]|nr:hypothetical protein [Woeseiaceae bacterium]
MAASIPTKRSRRWFFALTSVFLLLTLAMGIALWRLLQLDTLTSLANDVVRLDRAMRAVRWTIIALVLVSWPTLIKWVANRGACAAHNSARWLNARWRVVGWLIAMELLIGTSVLPSVFRLFGA